MADDTTADAVAISTGVVGALRAAGVLRTAGVVLTEELPTDTPPAPPPPRRAVGDRLSLYRIQAVTKTFEADPNDATQFVTQFVLTDESGAYGLDFPPNDARYIPELDRVLTAALTVTQRLYVTAGVEIAEVITNGEVWYRAELRGLSVWAANGQ